MFLSAKSEVDWAEVTAPPRLDLLASEKEQHSIYLLLAMALVFDGWCVNKHRPEQISLYTQVNRDRTVHDYFGHNVGALVVDPSGGILAFALNRSVELNSTLEHAEARAIRHAINRSNERGRAPWSFTSLLKGSRLYATLEPCSQCAGIAELAQLESVVYAQHDSLHCSVVNVLYNLHLRPEATRRRSRSERRSTRFGMNWRQRMRISSRRNRRTAARA